jgi:hypothetical protein
MILFSITKFYNNPIEKNIKRNILFRLYTHLKTRGLIYDNQKLKVILLPTNISILLQNFFQIEFLVFLLKSMRAVLNITLVLGLILDCNNRVNKLVDILVSVPVEIRVIFMKQNKKKFFI